MVAVLAVAASLLAPAVVPHAQPGGMLLAAAPVLLAGFLWGGRSSVAAAAVMALLVVPAAHAFSGVETLATAFDEVSWAYLVSLMAAAGLGTSLRELRRRHGRSVAGRLRAEQDVRFRDALIDATAGVTTALLRADEWRQVVGDVLAQLGTAAGVSRAYLVGFEFAGAGEGRTTERFGWEQGVCGADQAVLDSIVLGEKDFRSWAAPLMRGQPVHGTTPEATGEHAALLQSIGVRSYLIVPVCLRDRTWGFIGLDDCERERAWTEPEIDVLQIASGVIGSAIQHEMDFQAVSESEARYRLIADNISEVLWVDDLAQGRITYVSPAYEQIWGLPTSRLLEDRLSYLEAVHPDDRKPLFATSEELHELKGKQKESPPVEYRIIRPDGSIRWIRARVFPIRGRSGLTTKLIGLASDITDYREAIGALEKGEQKLRTVVETVKDVVFQLDPACGITFLNPAWHELTGFTMEQAIGQPLQDFIHPDDVESIGPLLCEVLGGGRDHCTAEMRVRLRSGAYRWVEAAVRRMQQSAGGATGSLHDINTRRMVLDALREALERERQTSEMRARFIATASHEFRTPLAAILGSAELLHLFASRWSAEKVEAQVTRIRESVRVMESVLEDLLLYEQGTTRRWQYAPTAEDLCTFLRDLVSEVAGSVGVHHQFTVECGEDIGSIEIDRRLARFALSNLLTNAAKYSPPASQVHVEASCTDGILRISVSDEGEGISLADQERVFEPFFRGDNSLTTRGTGLGLPIAQQAAHLQGGRIEMESVLGQGSCFTLVLPLRRIPADHSAISR